MRGLNSRAIPPAVEPRFNVWTIDLSYEGGRWNVLTADVPRGLAYVDVAAGNRRAVAYGTGLVFSAIPVGETPVLPALQNEVA